MQQCHTIGQQQQTQSQQHDIENESSSSPSQATSCCIGPGSHYNNNNSNTQLHAQLRILGISAGSASAPDYVMHTPPDRFLARAHLVEVRETPSTLLNNTKWDQLSQGIWRKFMSSQQTEETFKQKMRLWRYMYLIIKVIRNTSTKKEIFQAIENVCIVEYLSTLWSLFGWFNNLRLWFGCF